MIEIKINGEKKMIPTASELTAKQYIKVVQMHNELKEKNELNEISFLICYLATALDVSYKKAFFSKLSNYSLLKRIGDISDYATLNPVKRMVFKNGDFYYMPDEIETVGQRWVIEKNSSSLKTEEMLCLILAVALARDPMNSDSVNILKKKIMNEPYQDVLPTAFFLLKNLLIGKSSGASFFRKLMYSIAMRTSKSSSVLISF